MLDWVADRYAPYVDRVAVVAHPSFAADIERWGDARGGIDVLRQDSPTGMLDAILLASPLVERQQPDAIWITWCDQVGVLPATLDALARLETEHIPALAVPTVRGRDPYTHFERDDRGRITAVLHRREGDAMPAEGDCGMGGFVPFRGALLRLLPWYEVDILLVPVSLERNFVPFVAWAAARGEVVTFPCTDPMEAVGVNTPEDLARVETWLRARGGEVR
jgi:CTP:molybdopterin cytidylyltransferase MocA